MAGVTSVGTWNDHEGKVNREEGINSARRKEIERRNGIGRERRRNSKGKRVAQRIDDSSTQGEKGMENMEHVRENDSYWRIRAETATAKTRDERIA